MLTSKKQTGFTIVELLIVIVVIGILAAITIVAYNGVQNKANDTTIQADLRNLANKVHEQTAETGEYPAAVHPAIAGITSFPVTKGAYVTTEHNLYYCVGLIGGKREFAVAAVSKSGEKFKYDSVAGAAKYTGVWSGSAQICPGLGFSSYTYGIGYNKDNQAWSAWTK